MPVCAVEMSSNFRVELVVVGYIRKLQVRLNIEIPEDVWLLVIMFYPKCIEFEGNTMNLTMEEKDIITSWFLDIFDLEYNKSTLTSKLLYDYSKDGKEGKDFHKKCDGNINTFSIVETEFNGHILGCFLSKQLRKSDPEVHYGSLIDDDKVFVCVIRSCFKDKGPEMFQIRAGKYAYYNAPQYGPAVGLKDLRLLGTVGQCDHQVTFFSKNLCGNTLCGGNKFDSQNKERRFSIKEVNTFTINIHTN